MKQKSLGLFLLAAIALMFSIAMVSALAFSPSSPAPLTQSASTSSFTITNSEADTLTITYPTPITVSVGTNSIPITLAPASNFTIATGVTSTINITRGTVPTDFSKIGPYGTNVVLTATNTSSTADTRTITIPYINSFCSAGAQNASTLNLGKVDIANDGEGDSDTEWLPLDEISVEVNFENNGAEDLEDMTIELGLIEQDSRNNVADDLVWISSKDEQADINDVDSDDNARYTFEFKVSNDIDAGDYFLMIKAYPEGEETSTCIDSAADFTAFYFEEISIDRETNDERKIIFEDVKIEPSEAQCGGEVTITAKAYNIGDDQEAVKIKLYNKDIGVDLYKVLENFDADDSDTVEFTFNVPDAAKEAKYTLALTAKHDYDEDDDEDNGEQDFDDASFGETTDSKNAYLTVKGSCAGSIENVEINEDDFKSLNADVRAIAGKQAVYTLPVKNSGDKATTYKVSASGISAFAEATIDPVEFTLGAGESKNVEVALDIDDDAAPGEKEFTLTVAYGSTTKEQKVQIDVEKGGFFSSVITGGSILEKVKANGFIYTVMVIDLILIIAIIVAIRRMSARRIA